MHAYWHIVGCTTAQDMGRLTIKPPEAHRRCYDGSTAGRPHIYLGLPPSFTAKPVPFNPGRVKFDEFGAALIGVRVLTNLALAVWGTCFRAAGIDAAAV